MTLPLEKQHIRFLASIRARLLGIVVLFAVALIAIVAMLSWFTASDLYAGRQDELRTVVEVASKALQEQYDEFKRGAVSEAEAKERAKAIVRAMRYNANDYFFVQDKDVVTIVHGTRPDQEGRDGSQQKDQSGKYFFAEINKVATEQGQGFVNYEYPKPGAAMDQPSPKLSFVKLFAPWQWTVGTGMYIDDVEATVRSRVLWTAVIALALLIAIGGFGSVVMFRLSNRLAALSAVMTALASGDNDVALPPVAGADEVGDMTRAVQVFKQNAAERARMEAEAAEARAARDAEREANASQKAAAAAEKERAAQRLAEEQAAALAERERVSAEQSLAIKRLGEAVSNLANKNLAYRMTDRLAESYEPLRADLNSALKQLEQAFASIEQSVKAVGSGTQEIAVAANDLSKRTEQQASSLEESSAALNEITSRVTKTAAGAREATASVATARKVSESGLGIVRNAADAMKRIEGSSRKIGEIIGVIDEIAFQTNLLALNAGVEAARAGDSGRGFAVVAAEVRALAQRAAEAAKEIKALIATSSHEVKDGVTLVSDTAQSLSLIETSVATIDGAVSAIAADAQAQASGLSQVTSAISHMDQMTQQNAAMAEETTAASQSLAAAGEQLSRLVDQFALSKASEDALRQQLKAAAPHAFPAKAEPAAATRQRAVKRVGAGGGAEKATNEDDWREF
jgi:methyl-accepting chemotaxis protein